jgi:tetratricopeptide (TPR) repeat protein
LELECPRCGKKNVYEVATVHLSSTSGRAEDVLVAGERECLSCGEVPQFKVTQEGMLAVTAELIKMVLAGKQGRKYHGPLDVTQTRLHNGKVVSLAQALAEYRKKIAKDPRDATLRIGLGNIYQHLQYVRSAKDQFREAVRLDPAYVEASFALAELLKDERNGLAAFAVLEKALEHKRNWRFCRLTECSPTDFLWSFINSYNDLKKNLELSRKDLEFGDLQPSTVKNAAKVGRNDPCPCGSGKKYKKCCLGK